MPRRRTSTSNFGAGARESHDATAFYARFDPPAVSDDDDVLAPTVVDEPFQSGDARHMDAVAEGSVALVVTSPPYFAGKQYEEELERDGVPSSYIEYLQLLTDVFAECVRKLEPGGRIAVNVANLGRKPYRSLSADVIGILERLGLLLRGEVIWQKAEGAGGSCAWGSFRSAANPALRDVTERIVIASKGRFDRARTLPARAASGLPHQSTITGDEFMALTLDVWSIPPESARRVGHPAPFPVELPAQLIRLYTYRDDLVLDPFVGSGSALVAAARLGRRYVGYDVDPGYVGIARRRVATEAAAPDAASTADTAPTASRLAEKLLGDCGFAVRAGRQRIPGTGVTVDFAADDAVGDRWYFDVAGPLMAVGGGMLRGDVVWRALGRAAAVRDALDGAPFVILTPALPRVGSDGARALRGVGRDVVFDVIDLTDDDALDRLKRYAKGSSGSSRTRRTPSSRIGR